MPDSAKRFLQRWVITTLGVVVAANIVPGISYATVVGLLLASLILGVLNAIIRPVLVFFALPLVLLTLGLFLLVINAVLLYFVGALLTTFEVRDFWSAFWGGLVISVVSFLANLALGTGDTKVQVTRRVRRKGPPGDGNGPVIDV